MANKNVPWDTTTTVGWWRGVNSWSWEPDPIGGGWTKGGYCPRCGDSMDASWGGSTPGFGLEPFEDLSEALSRENLLKPFRSNDFPDANDDVIVIYCDCDDDHPGRPETIKSGCGQAAYFLKPTSQKGN